MRWRLLSGFMLVNLTFAVVTVGILVLAVRPAVTHERELRLREEVALAAGLLADPLERTPHVSAIDPKAKQLGRQLRLRVAVIRPGEHLADAGVGMAPEHPAPVFERFYRVGSERSRKLVGTGLGLSIVKHLLEAQGEAATATSTVGEVSKFAVSLPRGVC